jgi:hypothetical protein
MRTVIGIAVILLAMTLMDAVQYSYSDPHSSYLVTVDKTQDVLMAKFKAFLVKQGNSKPAADLVCESLTLTTDERRSIVEKAGASTFSMSSLGTITLTPAQISEFKAATMPSK